MPRPAAALLALLTLAGMPLGAQAPRETGAPVPAWHREYLEYMSRGSGRWVTDNAVYRSEAEPVTEYVQEFGLSFDGASMFGRLYGETDGRRGVVLWEYRTYWDAEAGAAVVLQVGWEGASGRGALRPLDDGTLHMEQVVATPNLPSRVEGQVITIVDENTFRMEAYGLNAAGTRVPTRTYTYVRQPVL